MAVAAGVIADALIIAVAASLDVAAQGRGTAPLQCVHHPELMGGQSVLGAVGVAVAEEDVGHFPEGLGHGGSIWLGCGDCLARTAALLFWLRFGLDRQAVERTAGAADGLGRDGGVAGGGVDAGMSEHDVYSVGIGAAFQ